MKKVSMHFFSITFVLVSVSACTPVKPWQRGNLALPQMALEGDAQEAGLRHHTFYSKEAASGADGGSGGGCGCN